MKGILKTHVQVDPTTCQLLWQYKGLEEVAMHYVDFLTAVAKTGSLLSKKDLSKALKAMYDGDTFLLDQFAQCMVERNPEGLQDQAPHGEDWSQDLQCCKEGV